MKLFNVLACSLSCIPFSTHPAFADTFYNFSFTGTVATGSPTTPFSGSGVFDAAPTTTANKYKIVSVTGTTDGSAISAIIPKGGFDSNDNFLFVDPTTGTASLDNAGVSYKLANGIDVGLFFGVPAQYQETLFGVTGGALVSEDETTPLTISSSIAATPEPGSLFLLGTGTLGLAGVLRRRLAKR